MGRRGGYRHLPLWVDGTKPVGHLCRSSDRALSCRAFSRDGSTTCRPNPQAIQHKREGSVRTKARKPRSPQRLPLVDSQSSAKLAWRFSRVFAVSNKIFYIASKGIPCSPGTICLVLCNVRADCQVRRCRRRSELDDVAIRFCRRRRRRQQFGRRPVSRARRPCCGNDGCALCPDFPAEIRSAGPAPSPAFPAFPGSFRPPPCTHDPGDHACTQLVAMNPAAPSGEPGRFVERGGHFCSLNADAVRAGQSPQGWLRQEPLERCFSLAGYRVFAVPMNSLNRDAPRPPEALDPRRPIGVATFSRLGLGLVAVTNGRLEPNACLDSRQIRQETRPCWKPTRATLKAGVYTTGKRPNVLAGALTRCRAGADRAGENTANQPATRRLTLGLVAAAEGRPSLPLGLLPGFSRIGAGPANILQRLAELARIRRPAVSRRRLSRRIGHRLGGPAPLGRSARRPTATSGPGN